MGASSLLLPTFTKLSECLCLYNNHIDVLDTSDDASMDKFNATYVDDEHNGAHDHDNNTYDDHGTSSIICGHTPIISRCYIDDLPMIYR